MENFIESINLRKIKIGIIGLGYVGLPLAMCFVQNGFKTYGFDIDENKISILAKGKSYLNHISEDSIKNLINSGLFDCSTDFSLISDIDAIIMCVPTPINKYREPDLSFIKMTLKEILPYLHKKMIISLESTTYPGTTEEIIKPKIEGYGFKIGEDIYLLFSPEREDPGNRTFSTSNIPKIVGGSTENCLEVGKMLYGSIIKTVVPVSSTQVAEMTKLLENIYRAVNIGLINEMKIIADKMGIDIWEVIAAASSKPFGFNAFYPGPGWGGHCIPVDPFYLTWKAKEFGLSTRFIELAGDINNFMPEWIIGKVVEGLNSQCKAVKNSKILVLGLAYKKNIDDSRESPAYEIIKKLLEKNADVYYYDPYINNFDGFAGNNMFVKAISFNKNNISDMDCVVIVTDHDCIDYQLLQKNSKLIIDTRCRYHENLDNVVRC